MRRTVTADYVAWQVEFEKLVRFAQAEQSDSFASSKHASDFSTRSTILFVFLSKVPNDVLKTVDELAQMDSAKFFASAMATALAA